MDLSKQRFKQLDINVRVRVTFEQGREVMARTYLYYSVKLYKLHDFYVELWYRPHHNRIDKAELVELDDVLHLYEKEIDISDIFAGGS